MTNLEAGSTVPAAAIVTPSDPPQPTSSPTSEAAPTSAPPGGGRGGKKGSLREIFVSFEQRDFRYLALSSLALGLGQWAQQIGIGWIAYEMTGSATQIGTVQAALGGIGIVIAPFAGYVADRYPRRLVLIWTTAASAVQAGLLAFLALTGMITLWQLYALAMAAGAIQAMTQPARQAFVYDITTDETLVNAVAMNSIIQNFARIAGPPLAAGLIGLWGAGGPFVMLAAAKVVAIGFTLAISKRTRQEQMRGRTNPLGSIGEGFKVTWRDRRVLGLVIVHTIPTLLVIPYLQYMPVIARDVLHGGPGAYGLLSSMVGWGAVVGLFVLALLRDPRRKGLLMLGGFIGYTVLLIGVSASTSLYLTMGLLIGIGVVNSVAFALNNTLIQIASPNAVRGRVMAVWQLTSGLQPLGALPMGFMIDRYGVPIGMGSFMVVATVVFILFTAGWGSVRRM